ncbi:MAG: hypothetical protein [Hatfieldvirus porci]|uniref:Uncharacterized protein n=1 Tax=phage Lak_Megaphage_RVC_JS4_GC31 TaxID=3109228 RepID=A0ABZ0Z1W7_9CAUD|nr:MAG: hypothetical protein [phage Lak_Megaphage_RVC_AP3_GC31]WQJ53184.1 MAG: hypothetical protein [phage Lak_Megaphage_RVC_JS4_GC31]
MSFTLDTNLYKKNLVYVPQGSGSQFKQQYSESNDYKSKIVFVEDTHEIFANGKSWGYNYDKELQDLSYRLDQHDVHMSIEDEHMSTIDSKIELWNSMLVNYNTLLETKISNLTTELNTYKSKVNTLESTVTSQNNTISQLSNRVAYLERKI